MRIRNFKLKAVSADLSAIALLLKNNSNLILLLSLFTCGLILGTLFVKNSEYFRYLISAFCICDNEPVRMLINGIFIVFMMLTSNFIMGLSLVGAPLIFISSVAEGIICSALYAYRLYHFGYDSFGAYFITDILFIIFQYVIFICSQITAINMSDSLKLYFGSRSAYVNLRNYLIKTAVYFVLSALFVIFFIFIRITQ